DRGCSFGSESAPCCHGETAKRRATVARRAIALPRSRARGRSVARFAAQGDSHMVKRDISSYRFGKHPPVRDYRTLRFRDYATAKLPAPPASFNALSRVFDNLGTRDIAHLFPMDGNDSLGDCTIAALAHAITLNQGFIKKKPKIPHT